MGIKQTRLSFQRGVHWKTEFVNNGQRKYGHTSKWDEMSQIWNNLTNTEIPFCCVCSVKTVDHKWCNKIISSMRRSASSPDETPRRELKIRRAAEYFWRTSRRFIRWWNTVSNASYYYSTKMILEGEINDAKMSSFSSDFQTLEERVAATVKCRLEASQLKSTPPPPVIAPIYLYIKKYLRL